MDERKALRGFTRMNCFHYLLQTIWKLLEQEAQLSLTNTLHAQMLPCRLRPFYVKPCGLTREYPKIASLGGAFSYGTGACLVQYKHAPSPRGLPCRIWSCWSNGTGVPMEIRRKKTGPSRLAFPGRHWNWHGSIGYKIMAENKRTPWGVPVEIV